ncbi:MAG: TROVE domain-containing protein [Bacteroidota bacterium]
MKFNYTRKGKNITKNHEMALAYELRDKMKLYTASVTTLLGDSFYEKEDVRLKRIRDLVRSLAKSNPLFVAKLAAYTRNKMYLRTVPLVLMAELAKVHNGDDLVRRGLNKVIQRPDEITEILAYYQMINPSEGTKKLGKLSKQVQKGIADAFNKFDEYQFAKYDRKTAVSLKDALFLTHPKAINETQQEIFDKIVQGKLSVPYTWETELSKVGQEEFSTEAAKKAAFREKWEELIFSEKLGYMALLRNLRNLLEYKISKEGIQKAAKLLADPIRVRKSRQLPFRFYSAYQEVEKHTSGLAPIFLEALEEAMKASIENLKGFDIDTRLLIASDVSGSMMQPISLRSKVHMIEIGLLLSSIMRSRSAQVINGIFGETYKIVQLPKKGIMSNVQRMRKMNVGYSTNGYLILKDLIERKVVVERILVFTDCQLWNSTTYSNETMAAYWSAYKEISPKAKIYLFDLAGYGTAPLDIIRQDVYLISGWSEKIFDVLESLEQAEKTLKMIEQIEI